MIAEIYGAPGCRYCTAAKQLLDSKKIANTYTDLTVGTNRVVLETKLGFQVTTVPQILVDGDYVGGFTELQKFLSAK